jgi:hypothetical protein
MYPQQRRQFIPQGAINLIGIAGGFFRLSVFITLRFDLSVLKRVATAWERQPVV